MHNPHFEKSTGQLIASALAGSWRNSLAPFPLSAEELTSITPTVIKGAMGALVWWRLRETPLAQSAAGLQLREVYRLDRLEARVHVHKIKSILTHLTDARIECVLMKGWSLARLYPEPGLRHYCDLDLCVAPNEYRRTLKALESLGPLALYVDVHRALGRHDKLSWKDLLDHSELTDFEGMPLRVLGSEDHLRLLCLHWLGHGAWGPLSLCDIAVALETRRADFDWDKTLGRDRKRADWVACALGLAHQLLGAKVDDTPVADRSRALPRWLVPAVMEQWKTCANPNYRDMALAEVTGLLGTPQKLLKEVSVRWRHPIRATMEARGHFNELPRWPYQLAALLLRSPELPKQVVKMFWRRIRSLIWSDASTRLQLTDEMSD